MAWVGFALQSNDSMTKDDIKSAKKVGFVGTPRMTMTQWNCREHSIDWRITVRGGPNTTTKQPRASVTVSEQKTRENQ